jgi:LysM repeat protein
MTYKKRFLTILLALVVAISVMGLAAQPARAASCAFYHTVSSGESLSWIGSYYGVSWPTLAANNNIKSPYTIYVGQQICIPSGGQYTYYPGYYYPTTYPYYYSRTTWDYRVIGVVKGKTVTIETSNFPDNVYFEVRIGCAYCGAAMTKVTDMDSDRGGTFKQRFTIPAAFAGYSQLEISLIQAKKGTTLKRVFNNVSSTRR